MMRTSSHISDADLRDEAGATMVEYGFVVTLIAAVVALALPSFAAAVSALFRDGLDALFA